MGDAIDAHPAFARGKGRVFWSITTVRGRRLCALPACRVTAFPPQTWPGTNGASSRRLGSARSNSSHVVFPNFAVLGRFISLLSLCGAQSNRMSHRGGDAPRVPLGRRPPTSSDAMHMRLSRSFIPTMKETPAEAQIASHRLMLRAGLVRQTSAGIYAWLPLGYRVLRNIEQIVREEQNAAGALEM